MVFASHSRALYVGVTNNLILRVFAHKNKTGADSHTAKYNINQLVYFEEMSDIKAAIAREKQIKGWTRAKKIALLESANPTWRDLSGEWD